MYLGYLGREIDDRIPVMTREDYFAREPIVSSTPTTRRTVTPTITEPVDTRPPVPESFDPYAQMKSQCAARSGFVWNDIRKMCVSTDPYVEQKNQCAMVGRQWDSVNNRCIYGQVVPETVVPPPQQPTGPTVPVPPPPAPTPVPIEPMLPEETGYTPRMPLPTLVPDISKPTDSAPANMQPVPYVPTSQPGAPVSVSVTQQPQKKSWLIPLLIAGVTVLSKGAS